MPKYDKSIARGGCHPFFFKEQLQVKSYFKILKPCQKTGKCFGESLRGGEVVKELQIFGMSIVN